MIILSAGHTGAGTGAQCATTQFDESAETIWLRNRVAEILTNKYGLVVLMDDDTASLKLLLKDLQHPNVGTQRVASYRSPDRKSDTPNEQNQHNERANARQDAARCVPTIEAVRSTRALNITKTTTDTTSTLRITLRPDTVFVPYTNHIRSDTIVIPDRICKTKMQKTQTANTLLILILIAIIIFLLKDRKTR